MPPSIANSHDDELSSEFFVVEESEPPKEDTIDLKHINLQNKREPKVISYLEKDDWFLRGVYLFVCYLAINMVGWILFAPGSSIYQYSKFHQDVLVPFWEKIGIFRVVPSHIATKYTDQHLAKLTHILPSAVWSAIIPFQMHPTWKNRHGKLHRQLGYVFTMISLLVAAGIMVIVHKKLTFEHGFPDVPKEDWEVSTQLANPTFFLLTFRFVYTLVQAVRMARAREFHLHRKYMVRHVATGIWVAAQRFIFIPCFMVYGEFAYPRPMPVPEWFRMKAFADAGLIAIVVVVLLGELTVKRLDYLRDQRAKSKTL